MSEWRGGDGVGVPAPITLTPNLAKPEPKRCSLRVAQPAYVVLSPVEVVRVAVALLARYARQIVGVLSCFDRIVVTGTLPGVCYAEGMAAFLRARHIRLFDFPR